MTIWVFKARLDIGRWLESRVISLVKELSSAKSRFIQSQYFSTFIYICSSFFFLSVLFLFSLFLSFVFPVSFLYLRAYMFSDIYVSVYLNANVFIVSSALTNSLVP